MKAGGDVDAFAEKREKAAVDGLRESMVACVKEKAEAETSKPDAKKLRTFQKECDARAKEQFQEKGGDVADFAVKKAAAAVETLREKKEAAIRSHSDVAALTDSSTDAEKRAAYKAAAKAAEADAKNAFLESGGDEDDLSLIHI